MTLKHPTQPRNPLQAGTITRTRRYFSLKVATDQVFCNRHRELNILSESITSNEHVVVVAPRRYGKTSLIMQAITKTNTPYAMIDLFCVSYQEEVARKLAKAVTEISRQLISRLQKNTQKIFDTLEGIFRCANISLKADGLEVSVDFSHKADPVNQITDLLSGLETLAQKMNKTAVLFIDEFQDILKTDDASKIQSAIRAVAQHSKNITYLFSGSSRTLLEHIFDTATQPLYLMCRKINLKRIDPQHLAAHAQQAWQDCTNQTLNDDTIATLLELTECHTYYFNHLCLKLLSYHSTPDAHTVRQAWHEIIEDELRKIIADLQNLTTNQMKVLTNIALQGAVNAPNSQAFVKHVAMPLSSIQRAIQFLLNHDYLFKSDQGALKLTDPAIRFFLTQRYEG